MQSIAERSQLQTQMGQEVIYLLLTSSMLGCVILAAYVLLNVNSSARLQNEVHRLTLVLKAAEKKLAAKESTDKPPIIILREADGYHFEAGSAEIAISFAEKIKTEIVPQIIAQAQAYKADVIEIIGHTDGVAVGPNLRVKSNLDLTIAAFIDGQQTEAPVPFDNAGLGMARAVAMAKALRASGLAEAFQILPLSAGSLIDPSDRYSPGNLRVDDQVRRRIEIRLRRRHL
jgi:flagellar motor protein MotB